MKMLAAHLCLMFATPWTIACQAPLFMGFSRQKYCSGFPFPPARNLFDPGIELESPTLQAVSLLSETPGKPKLGIPCFSSITLYPGHKSIRNGCTLEGQSRQYSSGTYRVNAPPSSGPSFQLLEKNSLLKKKKKRPKICVCVSVCQSFISVRLFATPRTVACQAPLSVEFSR